MNQEWLEKRRFVRANFACKIIIRSVRGNPSRADAAARAANGIHTPKERVIITCTENIGAGGIRVIINEKIDIASMVGLEIYLNDELIACGGKIVWVVEVGKNFDTGIEFHQIDEEDRRVIDNFVRAIVS